MDEKTMLGQLEELARGLAVEVRYEVMKGEGVFSPGGLCRLKDQYLLIVNSRAHIREKIDTIAMALKRFDLTQVYLRPGLREFFDTLPEENTSPPQEG